MRSTETSNSEYPLEPSDSLPDSAGRASELSAPKRLAFWVVAVFLLLGLALTCVEIALRVWVNYVFEAQSESSLVASEIPGLVYRLAPNQNKELVQTDQYGLRKRTGPAKVDHKILVLGDPIAFGSHVRYESSFVLLLERFLNERLGRPSGSGMQPFPAMKAFRNPSNLIWFYRP
jgi:hypothetical protein